MKSSSFFTAALLAAAILTPTLTLSAADSDAGNATQAQGKIGKTGEKLTKEEKKALREATTFNGTVSSVDEGDRTVSIEGARKLSGERTFTVDENTKIKIQGKAGAFEDLDINMSITVKFAEGETLAQAIQAKHRKENLGNKEFLLEAEKKKERAEAKKKKSAEID